MSAIRVVNGSYRNKSVQNQEFVLVSGCQTGARGNYVTVKNGGVFPNCPETIRISVDNISDIEYTNGMPSDNTVHFEKPALLHRKKERHLRRMQSEFHQGETRQFVCFLGTPWLPESLLQEWL